VSTEFRILHIGSLGFPIAWEEWYKFLEQVNGITIRHEVHDHFPAEIKALSQYDIVRTNRSLAREAYEFFPASNVLINQVQYVDLVYKKNGALWPFVSMKDMIHSMVVNYQPFINEKGAGLIVGINPEAIACAYGLIERGFRHITFVVNDPDSHGELLAQLKQSLFDIKIEFINREKMILLSGIYSMIVCFEDIVSQLDLQTAILYFNYLFRGGLIINAGYPIDKTPLLEEANAIKAKVVDLPEVQFYQEMAALQKVLVIDEISFQNFHQVVKRY
jgi:hypothetical protein